MLIFFIDEKDQEFYVELSNVDNKYYSVPFRFGSNKQQINLVVDTQTDWTMVIGTSCPKEMCQSEQQRYDRKSSSSGKNSPVAITSFNFGLGQVVGQATNDRTCLQTNWGKDMCVESGFNFFEVASTQGFSMLPNYSGVLGLAPEDEANGPNFIVKLKDEGIIGRKMASVLLQKKPLSSYITFGGKTDTMMFTVNGTQPINWYNSTSKTKWKLRVQNLHIRDRVNQWYLNPLDKDGFNYADASVDTFFRAIQIP